MTRPKTVLFVGAFSTPRGGVIGGQYVACRQLLDSPVSEHVRWLLVDASMKSLPPPGWITRIYLAIARVAAVFWHLLVHRVDSVLVFAPFRYIRVLDKALACFLGRMFGKRVVISFRSKIHPPPRWPRVGRALMRLILRWCDVVLCQSSAAADELARWFGTPREKLVVVPNWIDARPYHAAAPAAGRMPGDPPIVLYVGWLEAFKGIFTLAEASALLTARGQPQRLVYCGSGSAAEDLQRRCRELGISARVELRGWIDGQQKLAAYGEADVFVLVSEQEGLPNALIEAMASGLPVVTTAVGGIPSLVTDGENGYLVEPNDAEGLADALARLIGAPQIARQMGARNREKILSRHDMAVLWPRVVEALTGDAPPIDERADLIRHRADVGR